MTIHQLLLDIEYFDKVKSGEKNFEIRKDYQGYQVGDILELKSFKCYRNGNKSHYVRRDGDSILKTYNPNRADTVKVKVLDIYRPEEINQDLEIINGKEYATNLHIALFLKGVSNVLKKHFNSDKVPDDYVVMAIEVIE